MFKLLRFPYSSLRFSFFLKAKPILSTKATPKNLFQKLSSFNFSSIKEKDNTTSNLEQEFLKMAPEVNLSDDSVFTDRDQRISYKLLNAKLVEDVYAVFQAENKPEEPLTPDNYALIFYFLCSFKQKIQEQDLFLEILNKSLEKLSSISTVYLLNFLWSLGLYCYEFQLKLSEKDKKNLNEALLKKFESFNAQQTSSVAFALFQIYSEPQDRKNLNKLLEKTCEILMANELLITKIDIINFLVIFISSGYKHNLLLEKFGEISIKLKDSLTEEEIEKIVSLMSENKFSNKKFYYELISKFCSDKEAKPDLASNLIFSIANVIPDEVDLLKSLLKIIHAKWSFLNITNYVHIWLSLSKFKIKASDFGKTLNILKTMPAESKVFKLSDLEGYEIVNIMIAMSVLKLNEKEFMVLLIKELKKKLDSLQTQDLVNLARSFVIYVRIFEDFFLEIHSKCCDRYKELEKNDIALLRQTFQRVKLLIPDSPFVVSTSA